MTIALALLIASGVFAEAWAEVSLSYDVPPLVITYGDAGDDGVAATLGVDAAGAHILIDPSLDGLTIEQIRKVAAHEAVHAMLRARGVPYMGIYEEQTANNFAYCWAEIPYHPAIPCEKMLEAFR